MGLWRLTADLGWTETFPISAGFFSHWMVWIALAMALKFGASVLAAKLVPVGLASEPLNTVAEKSIENREPF